MSEIVKASWQSELGVAYRRRHQEDCAARKDISLDPPVGHPIQSVSRQLTHQPAHHSIHLVERLCIQPGLGVVLRAVNVIATER